MKVVIGEPVYHATKNNPDLDTCCGEVIGFGASHKWVRVRTCDGRTRLWTEENVISFQQEMGVDWETRPVQISK